MAAVALVGISGPSGGGKSTLARRLREALPGCALVSLDRLFLFSSSSWPDPGSSRPEHDPNPEPLAALAAGLERVRAGASVSVPGYDFRRRVGRAPRVVDPAPWILVVGVLAWATPALRRVFDRRIYVDCELELCRQRRRAREAGSATAAESDERWRVVLEHHRRWVEPQRSFADHVVVNDGSPEGLEAAALELASRWTGAAGAPPEARP